MKHFCTPRRVSGQCLLTTPSINRVITIILHCCNGVIQRVRVRERESFARPLLHETSLDLNHYSQCSPFSRLFSLPEAQRLPYLKDVERQGVQGLRLGVRFHHLKEAPQHIPRGLVPHTDTQPDWLVLSNVVDR